MNPDSAQLRQMRKDNLRYPEALQAVPRDEWPIDRIGGASVRTHLFRSRRFLVQVFREPNGYVRLSVNRTEWDERAKRFREDIAWDDLQRLKAEAGFADAWAVEVFPPEANVVNVANMRHLFLLPQAPGFGWHGYRQVAA